MEENKNKKIDFFYNLIHIFFWTFFIVILIFTFFVEFDIPILTYLIFSFFLGFYISNIVNINLFRWKEIKNK